MKFSFLVTLLVIGAATATHVRFTNRCGHGISVIRTENGRAPVEQAYLNPGHSSSGHFGSNGMNFKNGWEGKTLAEFSFNGWNQMDFYDLSVIVGYDTPMRIETDKGGPTVTCDHSQCPDAYLFPTDDTKAKGIGTGGTFTVTFCPR